MILYRKVTRPDTELVEGSFIVKKDDGSTMRLEPIELTEEIKRLTEEIMDMHPYKESGNRDSYSEYNEGWTDACCILEEALLNL